MNSGISIEFCTAADVEELQQFIGKYWAPGHILSRSRKLLEFQHGGQHNYNYVLARSSDKGLLGVLGFIPTSHFSLDLISHNEIWLALWKVRDDAGVPGLGLMLLKYLRAVHNDPVITAIGISKEVIPIYKMLGFRIANLNHYALFNPYIQKFSLDHGAVSVSAYGVSSDVDWCVDNDLAEVARPLCGSANGRKRSYRYFKARYCENPFYDYKFLSLRCASQGHLLSIFVLREVEIQGGRMSRLVDVIGDTGFGRNMVGALQGYMHSSSVEYIDVLTNLDLSHNEFFMLASPVLVLPNHLEPLSMTNTDITYASNAKGELIIFRGDSDQDRPNK